MRIPIDVRGPARRTVAAVAVSLVLVVVALAGAAASGRAAHTNGLATTFTVLNDISSTIPGQPTPGGNIGYDFAVSNGSNPTLNHVIVTESIGSTGTVAFIKATGTTCSGLNTATLTCQVDQLSSGAGFDVIVLFRTPAGATPGSPVTNTVLGTFDPQTPNTSNNRDNDTFGPGAVTRTYAGAADGSLGESLALSGEQLKAGGPAQTSSVSMPGSFVNNYNWAGTSLKNRTVTTPPCPTCLPYITDVTIPTASTFSTNGPFFDPASNTRPFTWTLVVPASAVPSHFTATRVFHDGTTLPACAIVGGNPVPNTSPPGICVTSLTQSPTAGITATGLALDNGSYWIG